MCQPKAGPIRPHILGPLQNSSPCTSAAACKHRSPAPPAVLSLLTLQTSPSGSLTVSYSYSLNLFLESSLPFLALPVTQPACLLAPCLPAGPEGQVVSLFSSVCFSVVFPSSVFAMHVIGLYYPWPFLSSSAGLPASLICGRCLRLGHCLTLDHFSFHFEQFPRLSR